MNDDLELQLVVAQSGENLPRLWIAQHGANMGRTLDLVEQLLARRPELGEGLQASLAYAAKVREHGTPEPPETPPSLTPVHLRTSIARQEARNHFLRAVADEVGRHQRVLGAVAWRFHALEDPAPSEPWHKGYKWVLRQHRKTRELDRHQRLHALEEAITAAATDDERALLSAEHATLKKAHVATICVDLTLC